MRMITKTKLPPPVVNSRGLSEYRLTKKHQAILQKWKDMRAYMNLANRAPPCVRLNAADYGDIDAAVRAQSEGKFTLADVKYEGVPILSAEISPQESFVA
jgi:hypothetical protein